jgi:hypothetical protein
VTLGAPCAVWVGAGCGAGAPGEGGGAAAAALLAAGEICDHVGAVMIGLEARKRHLVSGHHLRRISQIFIQRLGIPDDVSRLHRGRIVEAGFGACLAADHAGKRRTEQVLAGFNRMASLAFPEYQTPCPGITRGLCCIGLLRRLPGRSTRRSRAARRHVVMS